MSQTIYAQQAGNWSDSLGSGTWFDSPSGGNEVNGPTTLTDWDGDTVDLNGHQIMLDADVTAGQTVTVQDSAGLSGTALAVGWSGTVTATIQSGASLTLAATCGLYILATRGTVIVYGSLAIAGSLECDWSGALLIEGGGTATVLAGGYVNVGMGDPAQYFGWGVWASPSTIAVSGTLYVNDEGEVDVQEGALSITSGGNLVIGGSLGLNWYGSMTIDGTVTINGGGTLTIGANIGLYSALTVNGDGNLIADGSVIVNSDGGLLVVTGGNVAGAINAYPGAALALPAIVNVQSDPVSEQFAHYGASASDLRDGVTIGDVTGTLVGPQPSDVRNQTSYEIDNAGNPNTGTLAVPAAASVALGVPVDAAVGTAVLGESNVQTALASMLIDGVSWARAMRALLALVAGAMTVTDNGDGTNTVTCYAQDGTTVAWTARFSTSTGARPSTTIGA